MCHEQRSAPKESKTVVDDMTMVPLKVMFYLPWAFRDWSVLHTTGARQVTVFVLHL